MSESPCKYHPDRKATRLVGHGYGSVCEECWALICVGKNPAPTQVGNAPVPEKVETMAGDKCGCGRPATHSGRCAFRRGNIETKPAKTVKLTKPAKPVVKAASNGHASGRFAGVIAQLEADRDKLVEAIETLKRLN